mmetsp:Transcript_24297/g.35505  ORF Transcript_24297/g.35505 Transcript_24297/m.35505 type:complete len:90 (+) Transcript_24297:164-433(+)
MIHLKRSRFEFFAVACSRHPIITFESNIDGLFSSNHFVQQHQFSFTPKKGKKTLWKLILRTFKTRAVQTELHQGRKAESDLWFTLRELD